MNDVPQWKIWGLLVLTVGIPASVLIGGPLSEHLRAQDHRPSGVLEARKVVIRDEKGTVRITLGMTSEGASSISLYDINGQGKLNVAVNPDGMPAIGLLGKEKGQFVMIQAMKDGSAGLRVNGKRGLSMVAGALGEAGLIVQDGTETLEAWGVDQEGKSIAE